MTDYQRILVVSTMAGPDDVTRLRGRIRGQAVVLTAPTAEAKRVVTGLGATATPEVLLAPVRFPDVDRGHRLDEVVRRHAVADRYRDVVVVADPATIILLLRVLAPDQLAEGGPVTEVGLPRAARPVSLVHAGGGGVALAVVAGLLSGALPFWLLPLLVLLAGAVLYVVPGQRHLGETMMIAVAVSVLTTILAVAGSSRFPGSW